MKKINPIVKEYGKKFKHEYAQVLSAIKRYDEIFVYRHIRPDFDAVGAQMGLVTWIKDNFPTKKVHFTGDNHVSLCPRLFPTMEKIKTEDYPHKFLAIIVDVGDTSRVADIRFKKSKFRVKIDHHKTYEKIAKINILDEEIGAASELIADMILNIKGNYVLSKEAASFLYMGIVGDTGRFEFSNTSLHTFAIAEELVKTGINTAKITQEMNLKDTNDLAVTAHILSNYKLTEKGVAYYVLSNDDLMRLKITTERGKENVNLFSNIEGVNIWLSVTEDVTEPCWRVSIRSRDYSLRDIAEKFGGGGHHLAVGAKIKKLSELPKLIEALDELIK